MLVCSVVRLLCRMQGNLRGPSEEERVAATKVEYVSDPIRFGRLIATRRGELGLTQADVTARGGPSDYTLRKLERGETQRPDVATMTNLERALEWTRGSASRAFQGGDPDPLPSATVDDTLTLWTSLRPPSRITGIDQGVVIRTDGLADLTRASRALDDLPDLVPELASRITELRHRIDRLTRAWLIRQAEVARRDDMTSELVLTHDDHLRRPPPADAPHEDADDLRYLRWLTGYYTDLNPAELQTYEQRFRRNTGGGYS